MPKTDFQSIAASLEADGATVFKLRDPEHTAALALSGAHLFDPMHGRPMREWVQVPVQHVDQWHHLPEAAMRYVADLHR